MSFRCFLLSLCFIMVPSFIFPSTAQKNKPGPELNINEQIFPLNTHLQDLTSYLNKINSSKSTFQTPLILHLNNGEQDLKGLFHQLSTYYLGNDCYLIYFGNNFELMPLIESSSADGWLAFTPEMKVSPFIETDQHTTGNFLLKVQPDTKENEITAFLKQLKGELSSTQPWKQQHLYEISLPTKDIRTLAKEPWVLYLQPHFENKTLSNTQAEGYTNAMIAKRPTFMGGYQLDGEGVVAGVGDNSNPDHVDYIDRLIVNFSPSIDAEHGLHTSGTVLGGGLIDERYEGFAPKANLVTDFFSQIIAQAPVYYSNFGMVTTNNSYALDVSSCNYNGTYDVYSNFLDQQAYDLPKVLHVFAAGNDGRLTCPPYPKSYNTVVGAYSTAKNVITVGAMGLTHDINYEAFSRGPVNDGRLKPEITSMGYRLTSTSRHNTYSIISGTSMATPNVTGASVLLNEAYRRKHNNQLPENALIKLLLMNGASDIGRPGPDYFYGFGLLNVGHSLRMIEQEQHFSDSLNQGQTKSFPLVIPPNLAKVKIMLYWNDPAALPFNNGALINDLDIELKAPDNSIKLPLILNPSPGTVTDNATPGRDTLNNVEQVTLNQPAGGNYEIRVKGSRIPMGPQKFHLAYSFIEKGTFLQYPLGHEAFMAGDSTYIYWQADEGTSGFSLSLSTDNGSNWQVLNHNIPSQQRAWLWHIPESLHSSKCLLKISRGSQQSQTQSFTVIGRPEVRLSPNNLQCPGKIHLNWQPIEDAQGYEIYRKIGAKMEMVGTTIDTSFLIQGLTPDSLYWVAVAAIIDQQRGLRSLAIPYQPNQGQCQANSQRGDLALTEIVHPLSGRKHTQSEFSASEPLTIKVANRDQSALVNYAIHWQLNQDPWQSQNFQHQLNPGQPRAVQLSNLNLQDTGSYSLTVAVENLSRTDPDTHNDTLSLIVRHLPNQPLDLVQGFEENFESMEQLQLSGQKVMGIGGSTQWDFNPSTEHGRIRNHITTEITISGHQSISLDNKINEADSPILSSLNQFIGTFNLGAYDWFTDEVRCDFDYLLHAAPKFPDHNKLWIRGSDQDPWIPLYTYEYSPLTQGQIYQSGSLSLSDALEAAGQNFSSSTQLKWEQQDTSLISSPSYGNGFTFDNVNLYLVENDLQILAIETPINFNCALSSQVPLRVKVYNSTRNDLHNIPISYQLDSHTIITELIPIIGGKDTISYTFQSQMDLSAIGAHELSVWTSLASDSYPGNDSLLDFVIQNQPIISDFPYYEDFEQSDGHFYTNGLRSSWEYGIPESPIIDHAASGQRIWKTNLQGSYNDYEYSFLYSPCFDLSGIEQPTLSFSLATDIEENPSDNEVYDMAYVEYTLDGTEWHRLGSASQGYNWYNNPQANVWSKRGATYWHVATTPLPKVQGTLSFRFVLRTDPGASFEGVAIDDIHIYDLKYPIFTQDSLDQALSQQVGTNSEVAFRPNQENLAFIHNPGANLGAVSVNRFNHAYFFNADETQYFLPESFVIQSEQSPSDSVSLSLYLNGDAIKRIREDMACPSCAPIREIHQMGITQYSDEDHSRENSQLKDNENGNWHFIPSDQIRYLPYDRGYIAQFKVANFSEIWFNNGGPNKNAGINESLFNFEVFHEGPRLAGIKWSSALDVQTISYELQLLDSTYTFRTLQTITPLGQWFHEYHLTDTPRHLFQSFVSYRIKYLHENGNYYYSPTRHLNWFNEDEIFWVYPNPIRNQPLTLDWLKGFEKPLSWQVVDLQGRVIDQGTFPGYPWSGPQIIDFKREGLSSGMYLLRLFGTEKSWYFKLVYQK